MRNRYVKKCNCKPSATIERKVDILIKGVLDIELEVSCSECGRLYKEVYSKRTRMINPDISGEIIEVLETTNTGESDGLESNGSIDIETGESEEVTQQEEEPIDASPEIENSKNESADKKRDSDEAGSPNPVEGSQKKKRGRPPGKNKGTVDVPDRPIEEAMKDSGVPIGDFF